MAIRQEMDKPIPKAVVDYLAHLFATGEVKKYIRQGKILGIAQEEEFHSEVTRSVGVSPQMYQDENKRWHALIDDSGLVRAVPNKRRVELFGWSFSFATPDTTNKPLMKPKVMTSETHPYANLTSIDEVHYIFNSAKQKIETCRQLAYLLSAAANVLGYKPEIWYDYNNVPSNPHRF